MGHKMLFNRSFFRFLVLCGQTLRDLSNSVPMVRKHRQAVVPAFLSPEEVEGVLTATDRATLTGRRDHAILLLLARLGLRAGEIVSLELDDIRWRAGEIVVRGKGRMVDHLPLLSDVDRTRPFPSARPLARLPGEPVIMPTKRATKIRDPSHPMLFRNSDAA